MADRTVLTTGANSGIGLATVIELARRGFHSVGSVRSEAKAEAVHEAAARADVEVETGAPRPVRRSRRAVKLSERLLGDPARVARVIGRSLASPLPRARYLVGYDAQALALVHRVVPTTLKDRVIRLTLGL